MFVSSRSSEDLISESVSKYTTYVFEPQLLCFRPVLYWCCNCTFYLGEILICFESPEENIRLQFLNMYSNGSSSDLKFVLFNIYICNV